MCGIIGTIIGNDIFKQFRTLFEIFEYQATRGVDGGGISINKKGNINRIRSRQPSFLLSYYYKFVWDSLKTGDSIIFHHRMPTSTPNKIKCNHPLTDEKQTLFLSHNGVIWNKDSLYKKLKRHHTFESEDNQDVTDSELMVHVLHDNIRKYKNIKKALQNMINDVRGSLTFALHIKGEDGIYLYKQVNPLIVYTDTNKNWFFSSECNLKKYTLQKRLRDGELYFLSTKGLKKITEVKVPNQSYSKRYVYPSSSYSARELYLCEDTKTTLKSYIRLQVEGGGCGVTLNEICQVLKEEHPQDLPYNNKQREQLQHWIYDIQNSMAMTSCNSWGGSTNNGWGGSTKYDF